MTEMPYIEEVDELVEKALAKLMPESRGLVTKGLLVLEVLEDGESERSIAAVQVGRQGNMTPWEAIGILRVAEIQLEGVIATNLGGGDG